MSDQSQTNRPVGQPGKFERRVLPRCPLDTDVEVQIYSQSEKKFFQTQSINISMRGIELACDDDLIQAILAQNTYPHECKIKFKVPGQKKQFALSTQVVTHRRLSQHNYQLVLLFTNINEELHEKLLDVLAGFRVVTMNAVSNALKVVAAS
jgi:hypothetical protein